MSLHGIETWDMLTFVGIVLLVIGAVCATLGGLLLVAEEMKIDSHTDPYESSGLFLSGVMMGWMGIQLIVIK